AGGFFAANVLLARLQRKTQGRAAARIFGNADDAAGHVAFESVACGEEGGVGSAIAERDAETLGAADGDVRAEFTGRFEESESEEIGCDGDESAGVMSFGNEFGKIVNRTEGVRILEQNAEDFVGEFEKSVILDNDFDSERMSACFDDIDRLRM